MKFKTMAICLLMPGVAFAADSCPSNYIAINEPDVIITLDATCPTGHISVGNAVSCSSASPGNDCMIFYICPDLPANASWVNANECTWACNTGYGRTSRDTCAQICTAGITELKTGSGVSVPLYATAQTNPSINVKYNNTTCFGSLAENASDNAINLKYNNKTYHTIK